MVNDDVNPDEISVKDGNSTRKATDRELLHYLGYLRCADNDCSAETKALGIKSPIIRNPLRTSVIDVMAVTTAVVVSPSPTHTSSSEVRVTSAYLLRMMEIPPPCKELKGTCGRVYYGLL